MTPSESTIEGLLAEILAEEPATQEAALQAACHALPAAAAILQERFAQLQRLGLAGSRPRGLQAGQRFGRYRLLREVGRGGMGVVYLAEQDQPQREVAVKVLHPGLVHHERARQRFAQEVMAASRVEHPGICPVHDAGEVDGTPFLAMRYVPGQSLAEHLATIRRGGQTSDAIAMLRLCTKVAAALGAAHLRGLVHRDVKPANILLAEDGEPVLLDFGLARTLEDSTTALTLSHEVLGTPAYLAPEQIGQQHPLGPWTDVYALGVVLFECLTLVLPFDATSRDALYRRILTSSPPRLARYRTASRDWQVLLDTALAKHPDQRYADGNALAADLERLARHQPLLARPTPWPRRLWMWCMRQPAAAITILTMAVALVVVANLADAWLQARDDATANLRANRAFRLLDQDPVEALREAYDACTATGTPDLENLAVLRAALQRPLLAASHATAGPTHCGFAIAPNGDHAAWIGSQTGQHLLQWLDGDGVHTRDIGQRDLAPDLRYSPDGLRFAVVDRTGEVVRVLNRSGDLVAALALPPGAGRTNAVDWDPRGTRLAVATYDPAVPRSRLFLCDTTTWQLVHELVDPEHPMAGPLFGNVRFSHDGSFLVAANGAMGLPTNHGQDYRVRVWRSDGAFAFHHAMHDRSIYCLDVDAAHVVTGSFDGRVALAELCTGKVHVVDLGAKVTAVGFLPEGRVFAATASGALSVHDLALRAVSEFRPAAGRSIESVARLGDDALLTSVHREGRFLLDFDGRELTRLPGVDSAFGRSFDGSFGGQLLTYSPSEAVRLWDAMAPGLRRWAWPGSRDVQPLADGSGFLERTRTHVVVRDSTGAELRRVEMRLPIPNTMVADATPLIGAAAGVIALAEGHGIVRILGPANEQAFTLGVGLLHVVLAPEGRSCLVKTYSDTYCFIDRAADGTWVRQGDEWAPPLGGIRGPFVFRPGSYGAHLVSGGHGCLWLSRTGNGFAAPETLVERTVEGCQPAFSPDGLWLAVGGADGLVRRFRLPHRTVLAVCEHGPGLESLAIGDDGVVVSTSRDQVTVWSADGVRTDLLRSPRRAGFRHAWFTADRTRLVTIYQDHVAETWFATATAALSVAAQLLGR